MKEHQIGRNGGREQWEWCNNPFPPFPPPFFKPFLIQLNAPSGIRTCRHCQRHRQTEQRFYIIGYYDYFFKMKGGLPPPFPTTSNSTKILRIKKKISTQKSIIRYACTTHKTFLQKKIGAPKSIVRYSTREQIIITIFM